MIVLELFCGKKSISNAFAKRGHITYTVDWEPKFNPTLCADVGTLTAEQVIKLCGGASGYHLGFSGLYDFLSSSHRAS